MCQEAVLRLRSLNSPILLSGYRRPITLTLTREIARTVVCPRSKTLSNFAGRNTASVTPLLDVALQATNAA
jgi:hypothetical protein